MKKTRKDFRKLCFLSILIVLFLITIMSPSNNMSASAIYRYGYKEGDEYRFTMDLSSTADTEEGTATISESQATTFRIKDIEEDAGGYRVKITLIVATASTGGSIIDEQTMEGDPKPFTSGAGLYGGMPSMFITTDWEERGDEWKDYVDDLGSNKGWMIKDYTKSEGVFTVDIELDVSKDDSWIDYDDDGDTDSYTGTISTRVEYDSNGVLSSFSMQTNQEFNKRNSVGSSVKAYRGAPSPLSTEMFVYMAVVVAGFVVAFILGFFIGKRRMQKATSFSATEPTTEAPA